MIDKIFYSLVLFPAIQYELPFLWYTLVEVNEEYLWTMRVTLSNEKNTEHILFTHISLQEEKSKHKTKNWNLYWENDELLKGIHKVINETDKFDFNFFVPKSENIKIPFGTVLNITSKCNLFCDYCFNDYDYDLINRNTRDTLGLSSFIKIIDELYSAWTRDIILTWWEPFSCSFLWELLDYLKEKNIYTRINTNWTILQDSILERLNNNYSIHLMISMHEFNNKNYYEINKKWALNIYWIKNLSKWENKYEEKFNQLKKIHNYSNITYDFLTILTPKNILFLESIYSYVLAHFNLKDWHFFRLFWTGTTKWISSEMITLAIHKIYKLNLKYGTSFKIVDAVPFCVTKNIDIASKIIDWELSENHNVKTIITSEWNIQIMSAFDMHLWNIFEEWIKKIWEWDFVQKKLTNWFLPKDCYNCKYKNECMWGSRMDANIHNGSYDALDPLANLNNKV